MIIATYGGMTENHQLEIRKGLLKYFFPENALVKQKRAMRRMMLNPRGIKLRQFAAIIQELNNILLKFMRLGKSNNIT